MSGYVFPFWQGAVRDMSEVEVMVTLTRYTDLANNSDKFRRIFTVYDRKNVYRPYTFTHTGRWTHQTAGGNWAGGTVRVGKVVSNAAWMRAGNVHGRLHYTEVMRQKKDYSIAHPRDQVMDEANARAILTRLGTTDSITPAGPTRPVTNMAAPVQQQNVVPVAASAGSPHLGNRISALVAVAMDEKSDPLDLFAELAILKNELADHALQVERMQLDLKLANETILNRVTGDV